MKGRICLRFALVLGLAGCVSTSRVPDGIEFRSGNWFQAAESGFVVAPTAAVRVVTDPAQAAATFTNRFHLALLGSMPGTSLVSPEQTLYRLDAAGDAGYARFRAVRRALAARSVLAPDTLAALAADLEHRYLLVTWMQEGALEGIDDTAYDDYTTVERGEDVRRFTYERVRGRVSAAVVDLHEHEVLWRGNVDYATARLYGEDGAIRQELDRARGGAAIRLADFLGQL